jgi:hypothetical protein
VTEVGLRERKKGETRRTIAEVALELALQRGPDAVTVVRDHPHLRAAPVASQEALEHDLAEAVAARTGLDVDRDL